MNTQMLTVFRKKNPVTGAIVGFPILETINFIFFYRFVVSINIFGYMLMCARDIYSSDVFPNLVIEGSVLKYNLRLHTNTKKVEVVTKSNSHSLMESARDMTDMRGCFDRKLGARDPRLG